MDEISVIAKHNLILYTSIMYKALSNKRQELDKYRPLPPELVLNLEEWFRVELTYTSNAIEGNTLTRQETALVVEKGLTVSGKSLHEHFEAHNHAKALDFLKSQVAKSSCNITERHILEIHGFILKNIDDDNAGRYRRVPVRISGSMVILPNYIKVPDLMADFINRLFVHADKYHPVELALLAHYELVTIHPFADGNGRTARLLMNLILMQNGYPPAIIDKRERLRYITSLEKAQLGGSHKRFDKSRESFDQLIIKAVDRSLDIYLKAVRGESAPHAKKKQDLLKIGELAKLTGQAVSAIRYWTSLGLLEVAKTTEKGYSLYDKNQVERSKRILSLKADRYSLGEIKVLLQQDATD